MIKDYSNVPAIKKITNITGEQVLLNLNNIPVILEANEELTVSVKRSEHLAVLETRAADLKLVVETVEENTESNDEEPVQEEPTVEPDETEIEEPTVEE